jgi:ketosteroid isomerase-like protein
VHSLDAADAARTFIEAFNDEDLEALVAVLDPEVEIQTSRGIVIGHDEARRWATRIPTGELHQRLVLDWIRDEGRHVIVGAKREWFWREDGKIADAQDLAIVATIGDDGRITRWQPFEDRGEALQAAGVPAGGT